MIADLRIALIVCYVALLLWRTDAATQGIPEDWWLYILGFALIQFLLSASQRASEWWQWRRAVQAMRALGPEERRTQVGRIWLSGTRRQLTTLIEAEGTAQSDGAVERFPFARGARRTVSALFWCTTVVSLFIQLALVARLIRVAAPFGWSLFAIAICLAVVAAWSRQRTSYMETVLEIGPFSLALIQPKGRRRAIRWSDPLILRGRPRLRRLELSVAGQPIFIALDYDRVGIHRAVALVLERGGFELSNSDLGAPAA